MRTADAATAAGRRRAAELLDELACGIQPSSSLRIAIVVAHPDDETIGCGLLLACIPDVRLVLTTNGAPRDSRYWAPLGYASAEEYAAVRRRELHTVLEICGLDASRAHGLGFADQELSRSLGDALLALEPLLASAQVVFTHAYEGGHPDHDATALAVHAAVARIAGRGHPIGIVEFPLYRADDGGWLVQSFAGRREMVEWRPPIGGTLLAMKQRMYQSHASQAEVLRHFSPETEVYRLAPSYNFAEPPNDGRLLYDPRLSRMASPAWRGFARLARQSAGR